MQTQELTPELPPTGDMNLYGYVFNNPTNLTDPTGEIAPIIGAAAIACLRGAAQSAGQDLLIGLAKRKIEGGEINIDWMQAANSCLTGGFNAARGAFKFAQSKGPSGSEKPQKGSKQSKVPASGPTTTPIGGGKYTKTTTTIPGNGPGQSRADYVVIKNQDGDTIRTYKDSYDRAGNWVARTPLRGGPEGRPAN